MNKDKRLRELARLTKYQQSHSRDLPKSKQIMIKGVRVSIREFPRSSVSYKDWKRAIPCGSTPFTYLPPAERTYVCGRDWTISS